MPAAPIGRVNLVDGRFRHTGVDEFGEIETHGRTGEEDPVRGVCGDDSAGSHVPEFHEGVGHGDDGRIFFHLLPEESGQGGCRNIEFPEIVDDEESRRCW